MALEPNLFSFCIYSLPLNSIAIVFCVIGIVFLAILQFTRHDPHIQHIPGPVDNASWLYGSLPELLLTLPYGKSEFKWNEQFGSTYRLKGCFSEDILFTSDPATLRFILNDAKLFDFNPTRSFSILSFLGDRSLLGLRNGGEIHRRIKNAFSPAFTPSRLQSYVPIIKDIAQKATDKLIQQYSENEEHSSATVDIYRLLQHITSDVIGEVGFGYKFNAVETDGSNEVVQSHQGVLLLGAIRSKAAILADGVILHLPQILLKYMFCIPTQASRTLKKFLNLTGAWITAWLAESVQVLDSNGTEAGIIGFAAHQGNNQKREPLSHDSIREQTPTLLVAGQDTTANALAWAFVELASRPEWQDQIRREILEAQNTGTDLRFNKLDYLNAHIKETLRFRSPIPLTERVAFENTVLPLSQPLTTTSGHVITELPIQKGQTIYLGLASYNRNPHVWGADASSFDPMRWIDGRYDSANLPAIGPYSNLASFLGGGRVCLGWRLGILEMQVVLFELLSKFRFSFNPEQEKDLTSSFAITLLPYDAVSRKPRLSLLIQPTQA
ncbi:cytochrome P450 [Marasmius fiardii PR-910]|nr:cytochrome P450 [Marasmius fiardii PR-910]